MVSGDEAVAIINVLEARYGVSLADTIIRLMVKDIAINALPAFLVMDLKMEMAQADLLYNELISGLLVPVMPYLKGGSQVASGAAPSAEINNIKAPSEVAKSPFYFDPEDEAEVRKFAEKAKASNVEALYRQQTKDIIAKTELSFGSEVLLERLQHIIETYLSGVRNRIDTKLAFNKSIEQGGVNLDEATIEKIFKAADQFTKPDGLVQDRKIQGVTGVQDESIEKGSKEDFEKLKALGARDFEYDLGALELKNKDIQDKKELAKPLGRPKQEKESFDVSDSDPFAYRRPKEAVGKTIMSDVKVNLPKVMGPIDELHYLDLVVFRRLARLPEEGILKIKDKFDLLEAEMIGKKFEGIKAWRLSPIYQEYLKIAESSIKTDRPVVEIINEQLKTRPTGLNLAEFEAIIKLNKQIRF